MAMMSPTRGVCGLLLLSAAVCVLASGQSPAPAVVPLTEVHSIAGPSVGVPLEYPLTVPAAGTYTIELAHYGDTLTPPLPLSYLKLAVSAGGSLVPLTPAGASVSQPALLGAGSATFTAPAAGTYMIHVVAAPGTTPGPLVVSITIKDPDGNPYTFFSDMVAPPAGSPQANPGTLYNNFDIRNVNNYRITLSDLAFPQALDSLTLSLTAGAPSDATSLSAAGSVSKTLHGGTATVQAAGQLADGVTAGLYGVSVAPAAGENAAPLYSQAVPVGAVQQLAKDITLDAGTLYTLKVADLKFPAALTQAAAVVVENGVAVAQVSGGTSGQLTGDGGTYQVYAVGIPSTGSSTLPGTGSYAVSLVSASGTAVVNTARAVASAGSGALAYSYDTTAAAAQPYQLSVSDFAYPAGFAQITAAAAQGVGSSGGPVLLGSPVPGAGSQTFTPAAGPVTLLVVAKPASGGAGLFGLQMTGSGATPAFETTQGTGSLFASRTISVPASGNYQVSVADLGFPQSFGALSVVVTSGATKVASKASAGSLTFPAAAGNYDVSIIAQAGGSTDSAGTYSLTVSQGGSSSSSSTSSSSSSSSSASSSSSSSSSISSSSSASSSSPAGGGGHGGGGAVGGGLLAVLLAAAGMKLSRLRRG